jgi:twinkle protein
MIDWLCGKMWIYDLMGNVRTKSILDLMEYSYARHGVSWYVIDSLMKCGVSSEDYEGQRSFLNELSSFAKERNVHINLVAHSRKGKDEYDAPGKLDVKGSSDIVNQADNILTTWRNKEKEEKRRDNNLKEEDDKNIADAIVWCNKQRESGVEFKRKLGYAPKFFRFHPLGEEHFENMSILTRIHQEQNPIPETEEMPL